MVEPLLKPATYEDLLQVPDNLVAEILNGQLETHPRPSPKHARASSALGGKIWGPFDNGTNGPGGWWILDEPELHLGTDIMVPDLAGWKRDRMPELPDTAWFEIEPDWTCEIISPKTGRKDRVVKLPLYAKHGVNYLWLIDPEVQTLESYELRDERWLLLASRGGEDSVSLPPFVEIEFSLTVLWA